MDSEQKWYWVNMNAVYPPVGSEEKAEWDLPLDSPVQQKIAFRRWAALLDSLQVQVDAANTARQTPVESGR